MSDNGLRRHDHRSDLRKATPSQLSSIQTVAILLALVVVLAFSRPTASFASGTSGSPHSGMNAPAPPHALVASELQDVPYDPDNAAVLDWYAPATPPVANARWKLVIFVHGGVFKKGNETIDVTDDPFKSLLNANIALASVRYVLAPTEAFLTTVSQTDDVGRAVQFFRLNHAAFNVDPNGIVIYGSSAGGVIAGYVTYGPDMKDPASPLALNRQSSRPNAFINENGASYWPDFIDTTSGIYFGKNMLSQVSPSDLLAASAVYWLQQPAPPLVPVFNVFNVVTNPIGTPPITSHHDSYWGQLLDAAIHAADPHTASAIWYHGMGSLPMQTLIAWIKTNA